MKLIQLTPKYLTVVQNLGPSEATVTVNAIPIAFVPYTEVMLLVESSDQLVHGPPNLQHKEELVIVQHRRPVGIVEVYGVAHLFPPRPVPIGALGLIPSSRGRDDF